MQLMHVQCCWVQEGHWIVVFEKNRTWHCLTLFTVTLYCCYNFILYSTLLLNFRRPWWRIQQFWRSHRNHRSNVWGYVWGRWWRTGRVTGWNSARLHTPRTSRAFTLRFEECFRPRWSSNRCHCPERAYDQQAERYAQRIGQRHNLTHEQRHRLSLKSIT